MTDDDLTLAFLTARIVATAKDHGNRYLLPRRYRRWPLHLPDALDREYEACQWLVDRCEARWIARDSSMAPGIELR